MTPLARDARTDASAQPHEREARLLVELLRTSRLALLYATAGSDKTALLTLGIVPLLSRRTGDKAGAGAAPASGVVVPFPDRRSRPSARAPKRRREIVVYFGDWTDTPLAALRDALMSATGRAAGDRPAASVRLSQVLLDLTQRLDAHVIVLLDRFEEYLRAPPSDEGARLAEQLAEVINLASLPASVLIALDDVSRAHLASLRARIPGFDDFSLKLVPPRDFTAPVPPRAVPVLTDPVEAPGSPVDGAGASVARRKSKRAPLPREEVKTEDVYAMIEAAVTRIVANAGSATP